MRNLHRFTLCSITLFLILSASDVLYARAEQSKLDFGVEQFDCEQSSALDQLIELGKESHIPFGIEWRHRPDEPVATPVHLRGVSFREAVNLILMRQQDYDFEETQGLVHVYDRSVVRDTANFLNINLPQVLIDNENIFGVTFHLRISIQQVLHPTPGYAGGYGYGPGRADGFDALKVTINARDVAVRNVLNEAVVKQGNAMWVVILHPTAMMAHEQYYAQGYRRSSGAVGDDFSWEIVALNDHLKR